MKYSKISNIISSIVALLPIACSALIYDRLPEQLPLHYNIKGEVDNYADKWVLAFLLPGIMFVGNLIARIVMSKKEGKKEAATMLVAGWIFPIISLVLGTAVLIIGLK